MIRLVLVHEVRLVADLIVATLGAEPDLTLSLCVMTPEQAWPFVTSATCDVLLVSASLPADGALAVLRTVRQSQPAPKVLLIGVPECEALIVRYLEEGVAGYVSTEETVVSLVQKIQAVARHAFPLSPAITRAVLTRLRALKQSVNEFYGLQAMNPSTLYASLTARESAVLALIEQGYSNRQISAALYIEAGTVKNHVHNLLDKLGVPTRSQAAILARQALGTQALPALPHSPSDIAGGQRAVAPHCSPMSAALG